MPLMVALTFASLLFVGATNAQENPLILDTRGHFWVGGQMAESLYPNLPPDRYQPTGASAGATVIGASFVEYMIPHEKRAGAPAIVMIPGGGLLGTIYGTTPDRREGWDLFFVRRGFDVYVIEPAGRGRSAFAVDDFNRVKAGIAMPEAQGTIRRWTGHSWVTWDQGPRPGVRGAQQGNCPEKGASIADNPETCGGDQWPPGEAAYHQFLASLPVSGAGTGGGDAFNEGLVELLDEVGPAIVIGHSVGGTWLQALANQLPEQFRAAITVEAAPFLCASLPEDLSNFASVPYLSVVGGLEGQESRDPCANLIDRLVQLGGEASGVFLPDLGIYGNGHIMMQELNSAEIALVLLDWMEDNVLR